VWAAPVQLTKVGPAIQIAPSGSSDARRPALALLDASSAWIVWDESHGSDVLIKARLVRANGTLGNVVALTSGKGLHLAPAVATDREGRTWVAWYTNCWPDGTTDIVRRVEVAVLERSGQVSWPPQPEIVTRETTSTVQGLEFPQLAHSPDGRIWLSARASQNFFLVVFDGREWTLATRLEKDGWGGRGQRVAIVPVAKGEILTARRDLNDAVVQKLTLAEAPTVHIGKFSPKGRAPVPIARVRERIDFEPWGEWKFYFGDIHGHTSLSDGTGDVDEFYLMRRDIYAEDFAALTDHDSFVGNTISPSEWDEIKAITEHFNDPGKFVTLFGQEWTTLRVPRGSGHMNVYSCRRDIPLFDHTLAQFATAEKLVEAARTYDAIAVPHHIGWTGTTWEAFAPDVIPVIEIVSVHGAHEFMGNRPLAHRGGMAGHFAQDGLARGLRFGFIGGTDCHGLLWQHGECWKRDPYQAGLACVLAPELTREAVFEALRMRRCYATSGIRARIVFEANGTPMGAEIEASDKLEFKVDVSSESLLRWIEIVKDNTTVYTFGGEGHRSQFTWCDPEWKGNPAGRTSYFYLRVTCRDDNMAWSSPIWVRRSS
jgi:tRNA threonylcarbamoyladenosine modification (KEOPS) complex  Pcc1 subunit